MGNNLSCDVKRKSSSMACSRRHSAEHRLKKDKRFDKTNPDDERKKPSQRNKREALFAGAQLGCSLALVATETPNIFTAILSGLCAFRAAHVGRNSELSRREIIEMVLSMAGSFTGSRLLLFTPNSEIYMLAIGGFAGVAPLMLIKDSASYLVSCDPESLRIEPEPGFEDNLEKRARANRRDQWKMFTRILGWASQDGWMWGGAYAALLGTSVVSTHVPVFYSNLVKAVSTPGMDKFLAVRNLSSMLLLVTLIKTCQSIFFAEASTRMGVRVKKQLMKNILNQDLSFFDKTPEGVVLTQMSASNSVVSVVSSLIPGLMYCTAQTVTTFMILSRFDVKLAMITIIAVPADMGMSFWYSRLYERYNEKAQAIQSKSATVCTEMIGAMRTVRMFGAEKQRLGVFWKSVDELVKLRRTTNFIMAASNIVKTLIPHATSLGMFIYAGHLAGLGVIDVTQLVTVSMYQQSLTSSFQGFTRAWIAWGSVMGSTKRVFIFIDREPKQRKRGKLIPEKVEGNIEFQDVTFSYATNNNKNGEPVLQNFNLKIKPGQVVALVGPSGGGKTTVVSLLLGLYDPTSGQILIDGVPLHEYEPSNYHNNIISVVNQEPVLFSESVSKNVVLGLPKDSITQEQIEEACEQAYAHDFVIQLDKGYDTDVGRRGCKLSGGQRQRVAIARALVRNPNILVLDEATSALDAESESKVQKAVDKLMKGRTTVIVAHRLSTVQKADRILVINEGKIVEDGTHQELLDKDGVYARLISKQLEQNNTNTEGNKAQQK